METEGIKFASCAEIAGRWGVSSRRVRVLCEEGAIRGAVREGKLWRIPADAVKPSDGRSFRGSRLPAQVRRDLAEIDALKSELATRRPLTPGEVARLREEFLIGYTHASNAIEGNTLTLSETAFVLGGMTIAQKPIKDHLEAIGHRDAFCFLEDYVRDGMDLTESFIRQLHSLVLSDQPRDKGVYRRIPVMITGAAHTPPQPYLVEPMMSELVAEFAGTKLHPVVAAAMFHLRFEAIHPFIDGNGRTGRLLSNFLLMRSGFLPVSIKFENRMAYYESFTAYHSSQDAIPMLRIFMDEERRRLSDMLDILKRSN